MFRSPGYNDAQDVRQVLGGNRQAFEGLVRRYEGAVRGVALATCRDYHQAEDVAQEAFLRAFRDLQKLRKPEGVGPWLIQITRNAAIDALRRSAVRDAQALDHDSLGVQEDFEERELHRMLREEVMALPPAFREALLLHYFSGKSARECARLLGISPAAAHKRIERGRKQLAGKLEAQLAEAFTPLRHRAKSVAGIMAAIAVAPLPARAAVPAAAAPVSLAMLWKVLTVLLVALLGGGGWWYAQRDSETRAATATTLAASPATETTTPPAPTIKDVQETTAQEATVAETAAPAVRRPEYIEFPDGTASLGPEITGKILDPEGRPIPGASINAFATESPKVEATSGEDGSYTLRGLNNQEYTLRVLAAGYFPERATGNPGQRVDVRLSPGGMIYCRIRNAVNGLPVAGAKIAMRKEEAFSDSSGLTQFAPPAVAFIQSGEQVQIEARGFLRAYVPVNELLLSVDAEQEIHLQPMPVVKGLVVNHAGAPIPEVRIYSLDPGPRFLGDTDPEGRFELPYLDAWPKELLFSPFGLNWPSPDHESLAHILRNTPAFGLAKLELPQTSASPTLSYRVVMSGGAVLRGKVTAPPGIAGNERDYVGHVKLNFFDPRNAIPAVQVHEEFSPLRILPHETYQPINLETGEYAFPMLPGGDARVTVEFIQRDVLTAGRIATWTSKRTVHIQPGREQVLDFLPDSQVAVSGKVIRPEGYSPAATALGGVGMIEFEAHGKDYLEYLTVRFDESGAFYVDILGSSTLEVRVRAVGTQEEIWKKGLNLELPASGTFPLDIDLSDAEIQWPGQAAGS